MDRPGRSLDDVTLTTYRAGDTTTPVDAREPGRV